jgi:hypothetical protein
MGGRGRLLDEPGGEPIQPAEPAQASCGELKLGVEFVQVPPQPVNHSGAFAQEVFAVTHQQFQLPRRLVVDSSG